MSSESFFSSIQEHFDKELPFVVYNKPKSYKIKALLQKDDSLHKIEDFTETGFVFSPFDIRKDAILIPLSTSKTLITEEDVILEEFEVLKDVGVGNKEPYINLLNKAIEKIENNELEKVVLSRYIELQDHKIDPLLVFKRMVHIHNSAFVYCFYHPKVGLWLGATPETLLEIQGQDFTTMALAGTQPYEGIMDAHWNLKEREEQQIVTDYVTSNLEPLSSTLDVSEPQTVRSANVLHLRTDIKGRLLEANGLQKLIYALHPTPAVCGMPKIEAMQFIIDNEHYNREFYTGFMGELNREVKIQPRAGKLNIENRAYTYHKRASHLFVNLRCIQIQGNTVKIYVGGGITKDSNPENEWEETISKMFTARSVLSSD